MYKIGNIQTSGTNKDILKVARIFEDMEFSINVRDTNSNQMDSNIDERIIGALLKNYKVSTKKGDLRVEADGERVGELDVMFSDNDDIIFYMEIEKSNRKTLWFDYIKILTKLSLNEMSRGIVMCPTNYAHSVGVWDLYNEAIVYKNHLKRVFASDAIDRITVIGYTQFALFDHKWVAFDSDIVKKIKDSNS